MKKQLFFCFLIIFLASQLSAMQSLNGALVDDEEFLGITIEPSFGYLFGQVREIVYDSAGESTGGESSYVGNYLSELIWELSDVLYAGVSVSENFNNRLYVNTGIWTAVNKGTGFMNDYDWIYEDAFGTPYVLHDRNDKTDISHWSLSSVELVNSFVADINISFDILPMRAWNFSVIAGYKYLTWDWTDSIIDSYYDGSPDAIPVGVNAIDYMVDIHVPYLGIGGGFYPGENFFIDGRIVYSPFTIAADHDHHILRSIHFKDYVYFGQFISAAVKSGWKFNNSILMNIQVLGDYLFEKKGFTYVDDSLAGYAGIQYMSLAFSINFAFSF